MTPEQRPLRILQSFPHKIGAARICTTAWHQAAGVAEAGGEVLSFPAAVRKPLPEAVRVRPTLARGPVFVPYRLVGHLRMFDLHDRLVASALRRMRDPVDIVHVWPLGAHHTLLAARDLGIPSVLERPNAHTKFAYEVVRRESERLGVVLPPDNEHAYNETILAKEEVEYSLADRLLCPSRFVAQTFIREGFPRDKLARHGYGYDEHRFRPAPARRRRAGLTLLFVGVCAVRKGVHFALEAWLRSSASRDGRFLIAGDFLPAYAERLAGMLSHPSVHVLGHRHDVPDLLRSADAFVLPSLEEGFPLAALEAVGSGCPPLVSTACSEVCVDGRSGLVHAVGDVDTLSRQITAIADDDALLNRLRAGCLTTAPEFTWSRAGERLLDAYRDVVAIHAGETIQRNGHPSALIERPPGFAAR